jgi:hypothetical protein
LDKKERQYNNKRAHEKWLPGKSHHRRGVVRATRHVGTTAAAGWAPAAIGARVVIRPVTIAKAVAGVEEDGLRKDQLLHSEKTGEDVTMLKLQALKLMAVPRSGSQNSYSKGGLFSGTGIFRR